MADGTFNTDPLFNVKNYITACEAGELVIKDGFVNAVNKLEKAILLNQADQTQYTNVLVERVYNELNLIVTTELQENINE